MPDDHLRRSLGHCCVGQMACHGHLTANDCQSTLTSVEDAQKNFREPSHDAVEQAQDMAWSDGLRMVAELRGLAGELESHFVAKARDQDVSWERIGSALGVSRQAVHSKHQR